MGRPQHHADAHELVTLVGLIQGLGALDARLGLLSGFLLGRPYLERPLIGGPDEPEQLVTRLDGFDCVTYVETVLALARCSHPDDLATSLAALRYDGGAVAWHTRNHYMQLWIERNEASGAVHRVLGERWREEPAPRRLATLAGYPVVERRLAYLPKDEAPQLDGVARSGDVVCFVSTRDDLDAFHVGLLTGGARTGVRHASRSAGKVLDEPLAEFLARNETPGLMVVRPA